MPVFAAEKPLIAAASSLNGVIESITQAFNLHTNHQVRVSFGASGNLTRQILQGAPYDLFLSADKSYVVILQDKGLTDGSGEIYASGRLALFVPNDSTLQSNPTLTELPTALEDGHLQRLAIANPEHAPYGRAAREALRHLGLWQTIQGKLLMGENVAQAAQFTTSGADAGIVSHSVALELANSGQGTYVLLPESWHRPLRHYMVLLDPAGEVSRAFYDYLKQPEAQLVFRKFGFSTPTASQ
ncbi:molybdate ABC transporter substrate-binding protein [Gammaproteobacteria bacterium]|nr:molybdate ABC transporter substrate-binding protein [Gammaproteobacteria bacterium]